MQTLKTVAFAFIAMHLLAVLGFVTWLYASDRLSNDRVEQAIDIFRFSQAEEKRQEAEQAKQVAEEKRKAMEAARLKSLADGPKTQHEILAEAEMADAVAVARVTEMRAHKEHLMRSLEKVKELLVKQEEQLKQTREAFEKAREAYMEQLKDEDFQRAVTMYEQLPARQAKAMFMELIEKQQADQVVNYLMAMQPRNAAGILKQFKTPEEVARAAELVEKLRKHGANFIENEMGQSGANL